MDRLQAMATFVAVVDTGGFASAARKLELGLAVAHRALFGLERVAVIWVGALLVMDQKFSVGMLFAFVAFKEQFAQRVSSLIDKAVELARRPEVILVSFGDMLREVFARLANIRVRHRIFHDADSLAHWCREIMYLAEPVVLVMAVLMVRSAFARTFCIGWMYPSFQCQMSRSTRSPSLTVLKLAVTPAARVVNVAPPKPKRWPPSWVESACR